MNKSFKLQIDMGFANKNVGHVKSYNSGSSTDKTAATIHWMTAMILAKAGYLTAATGSQLLALVMQAELEISAMIHHGSWETGTVSICKQSFFEWQTDQFFEHLLNHWKYP